MPIPSSQGKIKNRQFCPKPKNPHPPQTECPTQPNMSLIFWFALVLISLCSALLLPRCSVTVFYFQSTKGMCAGYYCHRKKWKIQHRLHHRISSSGELRLIFEQLFSLWAAVVRSNCQKRWIRN